MLKARVNKETNKLEIIDKGKRVTITLFDKDTKSLKYREIECFYEDITSFINAKKEFYKQEGYKVIDVEKVNIQRTRVFDIDTIIDNIECTFTVDNC